MSKEKIDFNKEYESQLKMITVKVKNRDGEVEEVSVPVCYAKATTHIRKPLSDLKELENMMHKTIECSDCPFFESCMELTKVDLEFSQVIILRDIKDVLCAIGNVLLNFFKEVLDILKERLKNGG